MTVVLNKLVGPVPPGLHPYIAGVAFDPLRGAAPGKLLACTVCLNTHHVAPFVGELEFAERRAAFAAKHERCR